MLAMFLNYETQFKKTVHHSDWSPDKVIFQFALGKFTSQTIYTSPILGLDFRDLCIYFRNCAHQSDIFSFQVIIISGLRVPTVAKIQKCTEELIMGLSHDSNKPNLLYWFMQFIYLRNVKASDGGVEHSKLLGYVAVFTWHALSSDWGQPFLRDPIE
jgi:hypothetical protein